MSSATQFCHLCAMRDNRMVKFTPEDLKTHMATHFCQAPKTVNEDELIAVDFSSRKDYDQKTNKSEDLEQKPQEEKENEKSGAEGQKLIETYLSSSIFEAYSNTNIFREKLMDLIDENWDEPTVASTPSHTSEEVPEQPRVSPTPFRCALCTQTVLPTSVIEHCHRHAAIPQLFMAITLQPLQTLTNIINCAFPGYLNSFLVNLPPRM